MMNEINNLYLALCDSEGNTRNALWVSGCAPSVDIRSVHCSFYTYTVFADGPTNIQCPHYTIIGVIGNHFGPIYRNKSGYK